MHYDIYLECVNYIYNFVNAHNQTVIYQFEFTDHVANGHVTGEYTGECVDILWKKN